MPDQERKKTIIKEASDDLERLAEIIEDDELGEAISMPLNKAALAFRLKMETLQKLGEGKRELRMRVVDGELRVGLFRGLEERKLAVTFLGPFIQAIHQSQGRGFLTPFLNEDIPIEIPPILSDSPEIKAIIEQVETGTTGLSNEDFGALHGYYWANWLSLKMEGQEIGAHPNQILAAVSY